MSRFRVLYVSSAIGLGHLSKDLAIAEHLRARLPDVDVLWLAGRPASDALVEAGEAVLPEVLSWRSATDILERVASAGDPDLVDYAYRSMPAWLHNMRVVRRAVRTYDVDAVVGDEAWEIYIPMIVRLLRLAMPFVMITDFVGMKATGSTAFDHLKAYGLNALWTFDRTIFGRGRHSVVFIGEPEDIADEPMGWALPNRREYARDRYTFLGHVLRFDPAAYADRSAVRRRLGYGDEPLVVCSVGGTAVGRELLELCARAYRPLAERLPGVHLVLVAGPRIPTESIAAGEAVDVRGYVPALHEHHACCDVAVGQCGASSTTELMALGTPFIYFPVPGHYEQGLVAGRLERYAVGTRMSLGEATPERLADAIRDAYRRGPRHVPLPVDGARLAAEHIAGALERNVPSA